MTLVKTKYGRRSFIKTTVLASGGMLLGFSWLAGCRPSGQESATEWPDEWFEINGFIKIGDNGLVTIMSPNPEIGQNVKTSMPMIVAEELDVDWKQVVVEQAPLNTEIFTRQLAGGSQSIRQGWHSLRMAGATARQLLRQAAAQAWQVPLEEVKTQAGTLKHTPSGRTAGYGTFAAAAARLPIPEEVPLKDPKDFRIIGTSRKNVDGNKIVTGEPLFGIDYRRDGMLIAMIAHAPAFGMKLESLDAEVARRMPGIVDVFTIKTFADDYERQWCDTAAFNELVAVVGQTTWQVWQAKKALRIKWAPVAELESSSLHRARMRAMASQPAQVLRRDGNPEAMFRKAARIIERTYTAPFLAHNTLEPMNFFAHVTEERAELVGPTQTPEFMEKTLAARLGMPLEKIDIQMTRQGGGFGRRLYGHFMVEAALISKKVQAPVKLIYTREDDMSFGNYRPAYYATYRAALDENNQLLAFHVCAGGIPESPLFPNRFPAGAIDHYLAESWSVDSNISIGAWRAPRSNFIAGAEQAFLDELAEAMGQDPIEFRLALLERAKNDPVGADNDYDPARYAGVLELVRQKSDWGKALPEGIGRGVAAYYCHNSYVAQVVDLRIDAGKPIIENVCCAVDCGLVVNPDAAANMVEGGTVDGIGHALYSELSFRDGAPEQTNFDRYRLIRHSEAPKNIEVHFVDSHEHPTGLGEPPLPPVMGALANAIYRATGQRVYHQPFIKHHPLLG